ncbi:C40 family peptidase [Nocardia anaemiae]|uniref:C40 family peptidase n=1 Tax=Nocardia anaemiae TaxID=263910 RepID=UPI000B130536|nr:C40 family peptidase [Nocardia anaemiae]
MASTTEGRYSRFLRRVLPWAVGAGVIAGAAIAATLLAGGQASAQPLTIPGVGTLEVPNQFSIPGTEVPTDGRALPASIPAVADSVVPSEFAQAEVPGKELSAPPAIPDAELDTPLGVPGNELSIPPMIPGAKFSTPLAFLNIERSALPLVSAIGIAPSSDAPVPVRGKELSEPLTVRGPAFAVPLRALGIERSTLPLIPAVENSVVASDVAPVVLQGKELSVPLTVPELAVPLRAWGIERSTLPPIPAVEHPVTVSEIAPVEVRGTELSIPLAIPGTEISIPLGVLGLQRSAPLAIPGPERASPQAVPGAERALPFVIPWGERSSPPAPAELPATIPGTGITVPAEFRGELAYLAGVLGIKPPAATPGPAVSPERTHGAIAVDAARGKVGTAYSMGATGPDAFDCSGLVQWSYRQAGVKVPRTSYEQLSSGTPVSWDELEPGDVVSFYGGGHSALYAGEGKVIHASTYGTGVIMSPMSSMPYAGARRY